MINLETYRAIKLGGLIKGRAGDVCPNVTPIEEISLISFLCAPTLIIHHYGDCVYTMIYGCAELGNGHAETAITHH